MESDQAEYTGEAASWTPEQRKMGALVVKLEKLTEVMDRRVDMIGHELRELCKEIAWAEGGRQEESGREELVFGP